MTGLSGRQRNILICLCLALATAAVYWPVRHFEFTNYDDDLYITNNTHLRDGLTLRGLGWAFSTPLDQWMPVTWLARMLEYQLFGLDAGPAWRGAGAHHVVNVLFHIANAVLLFSVLDRMTDARWRSALAAALFALHPLHVESVAWATGLKDVLSMWFGLLTIWAYVRYVEHLNVQRSTPLAPLSAAASAKEEAPTTAGRSLVRRSLGEGGKLHVSYGLALVFFALALMSKPMMVTLPFVLLLLDYWPLGRTRWADPALTRSGPATDESVKVPASRLLKEKLPFFALAAGACVLTYWAQRGLGTVLSLEKLPLGTRIANALVSYVRYLGKAFWPTGLAFFYPLRPGLPAAAVMGAAVGLVGVTAAVVWRARRAPWLATGWFWYLGTLVPVIGLVQVGKQSMADRYTYVPLVGLFMMLCWSVPRRRIEGRIRKAIACVAAGAVIAVCAVLSRVQAGYWKDSDTLFYHALNVNWDNWLAHYNLGGNLRRAGRVQEAVGHFEQAVRIRPDFAEAHANWGVALAELGRVPEAINHYEQALRLKPGLAEPHYDLGVALAQAGRFQEALKHFEQAARINPGHADAHYNWGTMLARLGRVREAIPHWEEALRIKPDSPAEHNNVALALEHTGKRREAIGHYEQALRLKPGYAEAQNNLAWLLATLPPADGGDPARAVTLAQHACELTGNEVAPYLDTLAAAYAAAGRFDDAIATGQRALELARSAGEPQVVKEIEDHLHLFHEGHAYRQPISAPSPREP